jgi:hypothetical protein
VKHQGLFLLILSTSPAAIFIMHMCLSRALRHVPRQAVALVAALAGGIPAAFLLWMQVFRVEPQVSAVSILYAVVVYTGLAYFYFHLFNTSETARRIRLIYHIYRAGSLPMEELFRLYDVRDVVKLRLERLVETGQLRLKDGVYSIGTGPLYAAAVLVAWWQRILGMPSPPSSSVEGQE